MSELVEWLRAEIEADKAEAEADYEWKIVRDKDKGYYNETITRADAELAIMDEHHAINGGSSCAVCIVPEWGYPTHGGSHPAPYPCSTVLSLASGYRNRFGYPGETA